MLPAICFINAVSEKPISAAMLCIVVLSKSFSAIQTAAGFPLNFSLVKESTKYVFIFKFVVPKPHKNTKGEANKKKLTELRQSK